MCRYYLIGIVNYYSCQVSVWKGYHQTLSQNTRYNQVLRDFWRLDASIFAGARQNCYAATKWYFHDKHE